MIKVILVAENIRSYHNVGSLLRTADGLGVERVYLTGYTPRPPEPSDSRLPHEQARALSNIRKTSLGAEKTVNWLYESDINIVLRGLRQEGYHLTALEQTGEALDLNDYQPADKTALIVGNEIAGVSRPTLSACDDVIQIPMKGKKESLNVSTAAGIALYKLLSLR